MPRDLAIFDVYVPTLLLALLASGALAWLLDRGCARVGLYGLVWHPALFRMSLFACIFGGLGLAIYR
jgi:hypothetical protein